MDYKLPTTGFFSVFHEELEARKAARAAGAAESPQLPALRPPAAPPPAPPTSIDDDDALATPDSCPPELALVRTSQRLALEELMNSASFSEAARRAQVDRKTLYNWANKDPAFMAAMEAWNKRITQSAENRLAQGADIAAATLVTAAATDYRAAVLLLKGRGLLGDKTKTRRTPDDVITQVMSLPPAKRRLIELRLREMILSFREDPEPAPPSDTPQSPEIASDAPAEMPPRALPQQATEIVGSTDNAAQE